MPQEKPFQAFPQKDFQPKKPYGFVPLPEEFATFPPVWQDGSCSADRLSGEIRCELTTLTPLLVGWERSQIVPDPDQNPDKDGKAIWPISHTRISDEVVRVTWNGKSCDTIPSKNVLCPLRAPWGRKPVLLPGDSLKGLLRHELGALLGAPMERVAERSYSYRPNSMFPQYYNPRLIPRLARIPQDASAVELRELKLGSTTINVRVPVKLELLDENLKYARDGVTAQSYSFKGANGTSYIYKGGQGAGVQLNSPKWLHDSVKVQSTTPPVVQDVPPEVQEGYLNTIRHLADTTCGHFSERHPNVGKPDVGKTISSDQAHKTILEAAKTHAFQPGDIIWVEWDTQKEQIVSFGWHYYYHWAYVDTVRKNAWTVDRPGLVPVDDEKSTEDAPSKLTAVRRLFGYTGDNDGSAGIGRNDYSQLMGRISVNTAIEVVHENETDETRFLPPTFLKELGMPRPSAVEHYLQQPYIEQKINRPSDKARFVTYGDAAAINDTSYDTPGKLAGRKFYLDRQSATAEDNGEDNWKNKRSTLAWEASQLGRTFRFTVRFRDLDSAELDAVLVALCPNQFKEVRGSNHPPNGYCSKLGYARPLGWGSVRIEAREVLYQGCDAAKKYVLTPQNPVRLSDAGKVKDLPKFQSWFDIHGCNHLDAGDYPRFPNDEKIYSYHTKLRSTHSRYRRFNP
jgi:hypothetical protein